MKKIYLQPTTKLTLLAVESLLANSIKVDDSITATEANGGWVKEDRPSRYDVWSDDWSR